MGGQQPVKGAHIQLYAVGKGGDGSAAVPLLQSTVTTSDGSGASNANANTGNSNNTLPAGAFTISNSYSCQSQSTLVYITATGGDAGTGNNSGIAELAAIGPCGTLSTATNLNINEMTTVGALAALYPYASSISAIGSGTGDASSLASAFALANELVNITTGTAPGANVAQGNTVPTSTMESLANSMAACVNSKGGVAGESTPCGKLFNWTAPSTGSAPTDAVQALINIFHNPTSNVAGIFGLGGADAPFQPGLSSAPSSWSVVPVQNTTPAPMIAPAGGSYTGTQTVTLLSAVPGSSIYYTTDGSPASTGSAPYTGPFTLSATTNVKAVAVAPGSATSPASTAQLTIAPPPTQFPVALNSSTVFVGASTIQFWPLPLHNDGVAGWTTSQVLAAFANNVLGHGYTRVVIDCGLNDVLFYSADMPTSAVNNVAAMATMASQAGIHVIIATVQRPNPAITHSYDAGIDALNAGLKQLASQQGYTLVDFESLLENHPEYYADNLHPNAAGYAVMESLLSSTVNF